MQIDAISFQYRDVTLKKWKKNIPSNINIYYELLSFLMLEVQLGL